MIIAISLLHLVSLVFSQWCNCNSPEFNLPLNGGYSTMSITDPETGRVYQKIDDGSGQTKWIEPNEMCENKYVDGLGYVSVPSSSWRPGEGPRVLQEPPKSVMNQMKQLDNMGMMPPFGCSQPQQPQSCDQPQPSPPPQPQQQQYSTPPPQPAASSASSAPCGRPSPSRSARAARNMDRDAIRRGRVNW